MQAIQTAYFGEVSFPEASVIRFERGLPGFEHETAFVSISREDCAPLIFLQSLATPKLCFVTMSVLPLCAGYQIDMQPDELSALRLPADCKPGIGSEFACLAIISVGEDGPPTANLMAPLVIHVPGSRAVQIIQADPAYQLRHPIGGPACS
ncbi:flagellar assembly protein FliW [Paludibaculum fermentans]|uniref:Flagellar assembly factor FliW n=1 Tax=Paludibaculum fermentans TaxID=1473598 RepID=A0A7S7SJ19_PALFE|nr:flagellar assembly protein FliW [Paludibaculum fermentans]QOY85525.1 flagellar assembly protein FliW [Paludibaculum fermentans]